MSARHLSAHQARVRCFVLDAAGITDIDYSAGRPLRSLCNAAARAPEYAATKQALIDRLIAEGDFEAFPDAVRLAVAVQAAGLKLALASSSKNVGATLRQTIWKSAPAPNPRLASLARWRHPPTNSHPGPAPASIRSAAG